MTAEETKEKIFSDEAFVLEEVKRLQFFYGLKREIRYGEERSDMSNPESVAEHVYGMYVLLNYFLPLEDIESNWSRERIEKMILLHDLDEVITGDKIGYLKTKEDVANEEVALIDVYKAIPESMREESELLLKEYHKRETPEAKFVKAIDKIEPIVHLFNEGGKELLARMKTTYEQNASIKIQFFEEFPVIMHFYKVTSTQMFKEGFFFEES